MLEARVAVAEIPDEKYRALLQRLKQPEVVAAESD
jgi:hypothetical protein